MNRRVFSALLGALSVSAAALAAPPQYAVIDLGVDYLAGTGLRVMRQGVQSPRQDLPSSGGTNCLYGITSIAICSSGKAQHERAVRSRTLTQSAAHWALGGVSTNAGGWRYWPASSHGHSSRDSNCLTQPSAQ
jgi:hypothetical protein